MHTRAHCVRSHQSRLFLFFSRALQGILLRKYTTLPPPRLSRFIFFPKLNSTLGYGHFITHKKTHIDAAELPPCYSLLRNLNLPNFLCLITLVWNNTGQHRGVQWADTPSFYTTTGCWKSDVIQVHFYSTWAFHVHLCIESECVFQICVRQIFHIKTFLFLVLHRWFKKQHSYLKKVIKMNSRGTSFITSHMNFNSRCQHCSIVWPIDMMLLNHSCINAKDSRQHDDANW